MKSVTVKDLVDRFSLEVLVGESHMHRTIPKPRAYRPGLEFVGYFDFFSHAHVQVLGRKEINYLHTLSEEERNHRIGNIVKYHPPCFVVTRNQEGLKYLLKYCEEEGIPLLRTHELHSGFLNWWMRTWRKRWRRKLPSMAFVSMCPESVYCFAANPASVKAKPLIR